MAELDPGWVVAALLSLVVALLGVAWWRARTRIRRGNLARQSVAKRGERRAERLLRRAGYTVIERQLTGSFVMVVDGEEVDVTCRLDLLVEDARGARYAAEVKTGARATDPTRPATRRQLLEYERAYDVDGLLLVDMDQERVRTVVFPD
ncbi:MAG: hypothetical protein H6738_02455 [Alphaproteobacteria bacterium]|nr:hypothetical protein [Alphaproteobacteria bacterium]MCB9695632.1 hypothetical protein [Alphaproteobacteria bacterium]